MLKNKLMQKLDKKGAKDMHPLEKEAKLGVIKELSRQAGSMLGDKIHPMKKVTVASDSKEGLKAGLDKASGIVEGAGSPVDHETDPGKLVESAEEEMHADLDHDGEAGESPEHIAKVAGGLHNEPDPSPEDAALAAEHEDHSPEEIEAKIQKLMALKGKKQAGLC